IGDCGFGDFNADAADDDAMHVQSVPSAGAAASCGRRNAPAQQFSHRGGLRRLKPKIWAD
ncbi:hypothetical protein, partial [Mesorhizobium sp. M7A.F.Ca.MR.362.00.0.0]